MDYTQVILDEMTESGGDLHKATKRLGFNYQAAAMRLGLSKGTTSIELGKPELRKYIVAYRHIARPWPYHLRDALQDARQKFDAGTHEMVQGRTESYVIQYLIPRIVPCEPRRFFSAPHVN